MKFSFVKVDGNSMHPTLQSGAFVLVRYVSINNYIESPLSLLNRYLIPFLTIYLSKILKGSPVTLRWHKLAVRQVLRKLGMTLSVGDIVVVNHPKYGQIIKRITTIEYEPSETHIQHDKRIGRLLLKGDNPMASVSEADMGWIAAECVMGKVVYVVNKKPK